MSDALQALRQQLREKFPQAHQPWTQPEKEPQASSPFNPEAFPTGAISEIVPSPGPGIFGLLIARLLGEPEELSALPDFILIDGGDTFDPASFTPAACSRLLWVRCHQGLQTIRAADILVRDGNIPFILLDLCGLTKEENRAIPPKSWQRIKLSAEKTGCRLVVLSLYSQVPCATLRLRLSADLQLSDFARPRRELLETLRVTQELLRHAR